MLISVLRNRWRSGEKLGRKWKSGIRKVHCGLGVDQRGYSEARTTSYRDADLKLKDVLENRMEYTTETRRSEHEQI